MAQHHALAVVGAGPRGTSVVERLCASAPGFLAPGQHVTVHVIDPDPPGAGRVWRTEQSGELLMNTVASQVTLFTDDSVEAEGPIRPGPSLHEWHARTSPDAAPGPDDYPARALYGAYLEWVFREVLRTAPDSVRVEVHSARATRLSESAAGQQHLTLSDGTELPGLSCVVLAQGHLPTVPGPAQRHLAAHAETRALRYLPPANPADTASGLDGLAPGSPVLLRGLGLNFFDYMALLTTGRGGRFIRSAAGPLRYVPSGREPRLYAGSRRGVPYHARGDNEKGAHGRHDPLLLTPPVIAGFRERAETGDRPDFLTEVWPLVAKEVETVYYEALLARRPAPPGPYSRTPEPSFRTRFLATPHGSPEEAAVLRESGIGGPEARWEWDAVSRPCGEQAFASPGEHRAWLLARLREDIADARQGNVAGPVKAALDVLRDLRNELRLIVDHGGLAGASRRDHLDRWYTPLNAFLSIGPPRRRIEEAVALIEAGVLEVLGPRLEVTAVPGGFAARSPAVPGSSVTATTLIEARLPAPDLRRTADPLLRGLLEAGECRPHTVDGYETGGLDVTARPYRLVDAGGRAHPYRFAVGVPTEGVHWVTAAGARPGVGSVTLTDTDAVARAALLTLRPAHRRDPQPPAPVRDSVRAEPQSPFLDPANGTETQARRSPA
ncbi:FAD/NAD(P)-binding protein [Streptomyces iconiensis]|uniref:FAD/NAD(P)-binding protein n=1 Tax=Streptomyces iconiensis TaxID=1384038 RepID=A0ABT6ZNL6_9ACTN|nr:FAD/NAD(P)-binding protein [Streptomyces iconiensis]MDJ1130652.1 FAD/NAD(P)-binding protein [Streptomyces iconiensis]